MTTTTTMMMTTTTTTTKTTTTTTTTTTMTTTTTTTMIHMTMTTTTTTMVMTMTMMVVVVQTPERGEDGVEDSPRMIEEIRDLGVHACFSEVPVRTNLTYRTHLEMTAQLTRLLTTHTG